MATFDHLYPSAVRSFVDDLDASLAHLNLPAGQRNYARTTNLIELSFEEERRRPKTIPRFFDEHSALKLVSAPSPGRRPGGNACTSRTSSNVSSVGYANGIAIGTFCIRSGMVGAAEVQE